MESRITTGTVVALACSAMLAYAAPQQRDPQPQQPQQQTRPNTGAPPGATGAGTSRDQRLETTTMTGCLRQGASPRSFVFIQSPGTSVPDGGIGSVGGRDSHGTQYELIEDSKTDLSKLVGRQVEVTGSQDSVSGERSSTGDDRGNSSQAKLTRLDVKTIKQAGAGSC